jgi:hypothetical protein
MLLRSKLERFQSRSASGPFTDSSFHLLVGDQATFLDVALCFANGDKKCNLVRNIPVIYVVRKPVNRLENLILNAHVFLVEARHPRLNDAITLQLGNELPVRDGGLAAALGDNRQIFEILE